MLAGAALERLAERDKENLPLGGARGMTAGASRGFPCLRRPHAVTSSLLPTLAGGFGAGAGFTLCASTSLSEAC